MAENASANITGTAAEWTLALDRLKTFEYDGVNYRRDLEPRQQNLFWAGDFWERNPDSTPDNEDRAADRWGRHLMNAPFRILKVDFPLPKFSYETDNIRKASFLKDAQYTQDLTIDFLDDVYRSVQKYHMDWANRWYNRQFDVLRCGVKGKFRQLDIYAFHYVNSTGQLLEAPIIEILFRVKIRGMMPESWGNLTFDYGTPGNEAPLSVKYKANKTLWEYNPALYGGNFRNIWKGNGEFGALDNENVLNGVWNPAGPGKTSIPSSTSLTNQIEAMRTLASVTPNIVGEGEIS